MIEPTAHQETGASRTEIRPPMPIAFTVDHAPPAPEWDAFVAAQKHGHLLQTSRWGALKAAFGWR
ncbi:MAG: hypothetical protein KDD77_00665, partial [Caldilineaceae bacterium]|nr:hypothetical protein [Caldilineaceae bacterium]